MTEKRRGWQADPTGRHEHRYFSFDGRPTRLVKDGRFTSFDAPPAGLLPHPVGPSSPSTPVAAARADLPPPPAEVPAVVNPPLPRAIGRRHGGRRDLTRAGIVVGLTVLFGAGLAIAAFQAHHRGEKGVLPTVAAAGRTVNVSDPHVPGIRTVTVLSLVSPADARSVPAPQPGSEYAAAHVELCAGKAGTSGGPDLLYFDLVLANGTVVKPNPASTSNPSLATFTAIGANSCISGYVTFEIGRGTTPTLLRYEPDGLHDYEWRLQHHH